MKLSITRAWDEASAFVKQDAGTLFLIAFALMALPSVILQVIVQRWMPPPMQVTPGSTPDFGPFLSALPAIFLFLIPVVLLSVWGQLILSLLALRVESVVGSAFRHSARRILPLIGASLLWIAGAMICAIPVIAVAIPAMRAGHAGIGVLVIFLFWLALIFVAIRLLITAPVAAAEPLGPVGILRRSWQLTSGHFWRLFGFLILLFLALAVVAAVAGILLGMLMALVAGVPQPGSASFLVLQLLLGILRAIFLTYFFVTLARIYVQLAGDTVSVGRVFE